jgi:hypothetical protein
MLNAPKTVTQEERLFYSSVGFRAENIARILFKQRKEGQYKPNFILENGLQLVYECNGIFEKDNRYKPDELKDARFYGNLILGDIEELAKNPEGNRIFSEKRDEAKNAKNLLEKIAQEQEVSSEEVEKGLAFFNYLTDRCLRILS